MPLKESLLFKSMLYVLVNLLPMQVSIILITDPINREYLPQANEEMWEVCYVARSC